MKKFLLIVLSLVLINVISNAEAQTPTTDSGTTMKLEGTCSGNLADGTAVNLTYYSDFNGCSPESKSAVTFSSGIEGLYTGKRTLGDKDIHSYPDHSLSFANSTGNTEGILQYTDHQGAKQTVKVQCDIRDYEYAEEC